MEQTEGPEVQTPPDTATSETTTTTTETTPPEPSPPDIAWFVLRGDDRYGPVPNADVLAAYVEGQFEPGDLVWRDGFENWLAAEDVLPALVAEAAASAAAAATSPVAGEPASADAGDAAITVRSTTENDPANAGENPNAHADAIGAGGALAVPDTQADLPAEEPDPAHDRAAAAVAAAVELITREVSEGAAAIAAPVTDAAANVAAEAIVGAASAIETLAAPAAVPVADGTYVLNGAAQSFASLTAPPPLPLPLPSLATTPGAALWPMPVAEFLKGPYLQRADVVLTRKNRDIKSWLIRFATKGSFSHAALVFLVPHLEKGFNNSFVIESASGGVDLTNFADYVNDRRSVIGIKRLNVPWFTDEVQCAVRGRMLNSIKSTYDYATIFRLARELLADLAFGIKSRVLGPSKAIRSSYEKHIQPPNKFICSGLVQLGFVHTLLDMAGDKRLPPEFLSDIVFREDLREFLPADWNEFSADEQHEIMWEFATGFADLLEAATPEDLAASPQLEWVYVIRRGMVFPATSDEEARELLTWKPRKRRKL